MPSSPMTSAADTLIKAADKAGERTASSAMDSTFKDFQLPTDPNKLGQMYGQVADDLKQELDIGGALQRSNDLSSDSGMADAAAVFETRIKGEELDKTPIGDLDKEIDRLSSQRWGILPAIMGRSDIIDYGEKMRLVGRAGNILDTEIDRLTQSRERMVSAAESRAKDRTEQLRAQAALLDKQTTAAQNDLRARIDLFKEGKGTFDDIVQASLQLKKLNDDKAKAGAAGGNPFLGMGAGGQYTTAQVAAFAYFEKFGDFPGVDSSKLQLKQQMVEMYTKWVGAGRPGSQVQVQKPLPAGVSGPANVEVKDVADLFATPASAKQNTGFWGAAPIGAPLPAPAAASPGGGQISEDGEYIPPN